MVIRKYNIEEMREIFGYGDTKASRATIYRKMNDPTFPAPINRNPLCWVAAHVDLWIESHNKLTAAH